VAALALLTLPCLFLQGVREHPWDVLFGQVVPALVLLLIWAIPFDMLMARVFMSDAQDTERTRYRAIIQFDLVIWGALLLFWGYFFLRLIGQRLG
jgi:hypothetical protein